MLQFLLDDDADDDAAHAAANPADGAADAVEAAMPGAVARRGRRFGFSHSDITRSKISTGMPKSQNSKLKIGKTDLWVICALIDHPKLPESHSLQQQHQHKVGKF